MEIINIVSDFFSYLKIKTKSNQSQKTESQNTQKLKIRGFRLKIYTQRNIELRPFFGAA